jgi:uncharacterized membrane protein
MFDQHSPAGKRVSQVLKAEAKKENHGMLPIYEEKGVYNFYLKLGKHGSIAPLETSAPVPQKPMTAAEIVSRLDKDDALREKISELMRSQGPSGGPRPP